MLRKSKFSPFQRNLMKFTFFSLFSFFFFRRLKRICISKASLKIQSNVKCNSEYDWGLHNAMSFYFFFFFLFPDPSVASIWFRSIPEATRTAHLRAFGWQTAESFSSDDFNYNWVSLITYAWAKVDFIFRGCAKNVTRSKILLFFFCYQVRRSEKSCKSESSHVANGTCSSHKTTLFASYHRRQAWEWQSENQRI